MEAHKIAVRPNQPENSENSLGMERMSSSLGSRVFLISILAIPITYAFNRSLDSLKITDSSTIAIIGCGVGLAVLTIIIVATKADLQRFNCQRYPFYVFSCLCFTSVCSITIALELEGLISGFCSTFLKNGDVHLRSAFGAMIFHWNGILVYAISVTIIAAITWNNEFHDTLCFWLGSWFNISIVLIIGMLAGKNGPNWMTLLYLPYIIIPLHMSSYFLNAQPSTTTDTRISIWKRPYDLFLVIYFLFATLVAIFRGIIVLDSPLWFCKWYAKFAEPYLFASSPAPFAKVQMLLYMFTYTPFYLLCIYRLSTSTTHQISESSLVHAGASLSAQVTHVGASIHPRTPYIFRVPSDWSSQAVFWTINLALAIGPQLFAQRCVPQCEYRIEHSNNQLKKEDKSKSN